MGGGRQDSGAAEAGLREESGAKAAGLQSRERLCRVGEGAGEQVASGASCVLSAS